LLRRIHEAKGTIKELDGAEEMVRAWRNTIFHLTEEAAMEFLDQETNRFDSKNYQVVPMVIIFTEHEAITTDIRLYLTENDDIPTGVLRKADEGTIFSLLIGALSTHAGSD
jgi:hypothetical protein